MTKKQIDYTNWSKDELIIELKRIKETTYGLVWHRNVPQEKIDVLINPDSRTPEEMFANEVAGKPFPVLKDVKSKEVVSDKKDQTHILIEGDNYHSLAVLNFTHQEAIDVIYIDPPYNTGNDDFIYSDNFKSDFVEKEDPFRHSKWLSFMEKRLKLAHKLLKDSGLILVSIDDNEQAPLKMLCDEIFNERNFIANVVVHSNPRGRQSSSHIVETHEYILVYSKSNQAAIRGSKLTEKQLKEYNKVDKNGCYREIGLRLRGGRATAEQSPTLHFPLYYNSKTDELSTDEEDGGGWIRLTPKFTDGTLGTWRWSKDKINKDKHLLVARKINGKDGPRYDVFQKDYLTDDKRRKIKSLWDETEINYDRAARELKEIFGKKVFDYAKPLSLLRKIITMSLPEDGTILDFMAGSGTTGHAVLELNKEDGGQRQFILCTNNENNIATEVCQPRLQKVMKGYKNNKGEKIEGLGGNLKYFTAYDFVESEPSDKNKHKLVNKCTEMLCIKEGIYDLVTETEDYKILKSNDDRYLGIIFYEDAIDEYKKVIKKIDAQINTYVFSLGDDPHTAQFADVADKVALQAIPEIILKVYQEIFK